MANSEHIEILDRGVDYWNEWRSDNNNTKPDFSPDLSGVDLSGRNLNGVMFDSVNLSNSNLDSAQVERASFTRADLTNANLTSGYFANSNFTNAIMDTARFSSSHMFGARLVSCSADNCDFKVCDLDRADLRYSSFYESDFSHANLDGVDFTNSILERAIFQHANLERVNFTRVNLKDSYFDGCDLGGTIFAEVNLSGVCALDEAIHTGYSTIDVRSLIISDELPLRFLRGVGLPDIFIDFLPSLKNQPIQFYSCFISYSDHDKDFANRLHADLQEKGVRCWYAPHDLKIGDKIRDRIDQSIKIYDKLLLVLSENSIKSDWVESEVEAAIEKGKKSGDQVLFPIRIDNDVMKTDKAWAADIRRKIHIGDFVNWKHQDEYQKTFQRLLRDIKGVGESVDDNVRKDDGFDDDIPF